MKIKTWGARGSTPAPLKPDEIEEKICQAIYGLPDIDTHDMEAIRAYVHSLPPLIRGTAGGNTSCVEVQAGEEVFIIDAGSGLRELGMELMKGPCGRGEGRLHLFFSHPHWDHIQGFPFFRPAFIPGNRIFIYSIHDLKTALTDQQRFLNFPVSLSYMQATMEFISAPVGQPFWVGKTLITALENAHPGRAYSYRFEDQHSIFVYANDAEYKQLDDAGIQPYAHFFRNADALIFDAQYTLKEAWQKVDWGHSSALIGVDLARAAGVKRLILFHHDPTYTDAQLQEIQSKATDYQAQDTSRPMCEVIVAYEGLTLDLTSPGIIDLQPGTEGEASVLTPTSIFDERGLRQLMQQLARQDSATNSIIDLSQVETLTTASLKLLVALQREQEGAQIVLAAPSAQVQKIIELSDYANLFAIYPSVEMAQAALQVRETLNLPGQMVGGRYQIIAKIGGGRLGTTLKATDTQLTRTIALKILSPTFSPQTIERFLQQAQQIVKLDHRHIVNVFEVGIEQDYSFIVEEFVTGQTLREWLAERGRPISLDQAMDIALEIAVALEYAHSRGVLHGDLKPQNIFLTAQGVKLSDFGLGRLEEGHNFLNVPLLFLTAAYLAPEQIQGGPIEARTDLYALGVIFYELFTGQLPFSGDDETVIQAHLQQPPRSPRQLNPHISVGLEHLLLKLLAKNPDDRYGSVQQVRRILRSLSVGAGGAFGQQRWTLVGRDEEIQTLQALWARARVGQGQLVFITGEPGIGKTSLAYSVAAQSETSILLVGQCQQLASSPAYLPFAEALRTYLSIVPPETLAVERQQLLSHFAPLTPELPQLIPDLPALSSLGSEEVWSRLMTGLTQFIKQATVDQPWLLILEDLQWADQNSLAVLRHLGQYLSTMRLLILCTYLGPELEPGHPLQEILDDLQHHPACRRFSLNRLDQAGVNEILVNLWQQSVPATWLEKIYQQTKGNPFYTLEVARGLVDDGLIALQEGVWHFPLLEESHLPQNIHDAIWRRTRHLSPDTQTLLRQASVLGQRFQFKDLQALSNLSERQVMEHLDMALERQLLQEDSGGDRFYFSHTEIQYVLYADLGTVRRQLLHRHAGDLLEQQAQPEPERIAAQLAYHFGEAGELKKTFIYGVQAGHQAKASYAREQALVWYRHSLDILSQLGPGDRMTFRSSWLSIYKSLGEVLTWLGRYDEALEYYASARVLVEAEPEAADYGRQLVELYGKTAEVYEKRGEHNRALEWLEKGSSYRQ